MVRKPQPPPAVRLLASLGASEPRLLDELAGRLTLELGEVADQSARWPAPGPHLAAWAQAVGEHIEAYARPVAGADWQRQWLAFAEPIDPAYLPRLKIHAERVEHLFLTSAGERRVALDVAYLDPARLVRATRADAPHRIYLGNGLFGEILFHWHGAAAGDALPWTPAGEQEAPARAFFDRVHEAWLARLAQERLAREPRRAEQEQCATDALRDAGGHPTQGGPHA